MKTKQTGLILMLSSIYYLIAEAVCAVTFNDNIINTYLLHTISELGIPNLNSQHYYLMNSAFILIGLALLFSNTIKFKDLIRRNRKLFYILTCITSIGVIIVGLVHGGNPLTSGYHTLGAVMAILGGNILLVVISRSTINFRLYEKITLMLGFIGLVAFWVTFFSMNNPYMPVLERLSVYTLILWSLYTGISLFKNKV